MRLVVRDFSDPLGTIDMRHDTSGLGDEGHDVGDDFGMWGFLASVNVYGKALFLTITLDASFHGWPEVRLFLSPLERKPAS